MLGWEYASVEWVWSDGALRCNFPGVGETHRAGSYQEVVEVLTQFGAQGWEVVSCVGVANWLYWTLKRPASGRPVVS
jgi:hypothetical protein